VEIPNWVTLKDFLVREGRISKDDLVYIIRGVINVMKKEANVVRVTGPTVLVGDIHGQFYDLVNLIDKAGDPKYKK